MKNKYKILFIVSIFFISNIFLLNVKALDDLDLQIYPIKDKIMINNVFKFYDENNKSVIKVVVNENRQKLEDEEILENNENTNNIENETLETESNTEIASVSNYYGESANFDSKYTDLATYALQFVGNPYVSGGTSLTDGADCSGFVMKLYEHYGVSLPRTAGDQATVGYSVSIENAQPGDIISYGYNGVVGHSAIYIGNERIVHAATPKDGITTASMYMMPIITIRRIG